jgi:hypothetical protein
MEDKITDKEVELWLLDLRNNLNKLLEYLAVKLETEEKDAKTE